MFLTLVAVLIALALGHIAPELATSVRQFAWYQAWLRWLDERFAQDDGIWRSRYGIVIALLPPLVIVGIFQFALADSLRGLPGILFGIAVLFYAWGPTDLDLEVDAIVDADDAVARHNAASHLWPPGQPVSMDGPSLVGAVFRNAKRRWFGVLFWFMVLGPVGALLYRLTAIAAEGEATHLMPPETTAGARLLLSILDWSVAHLMTLAMALVGNFDAVVGAWRDYGRSAFLLDTGFLAAAARASVQSEVAQEMADDATDDTEAGVGLRRALVIALPPLSELRDAMSLVWRILLLWLAVIAVFVIGGWVG